MQVYSDASIDFDNKLCSIACIIETDNESIVVVRESYYVDNIAIAEGEALLLSKDFDIKKADFFIDCQVLYNVVMHPKGNEPEQLKKVGKKIRKLLDNKESNLYVVQRYLLEDVHKLAFENLLKLRGPDGIQS